MSPQGRNRLIASGAVLVALAALSWIAFGNIGENLVYYWKPSEMVAQGEKALGATVRLGEGAYQADAVFRTNRLMVNHSNEYRAPTDGGMPSEAWKQSLSRAD